MTVSGCLGDKDFWYWRSSGGQLGMKNVSHGAEFNNSFVSFHKLGFLVKTSLLCKVTVLSSKLVSKSTKPY